MCISHLCLVQRLRSCATVILTCHLVKFLSAVSFIKAMCKNVILLKLVIFKKILLVCHINLVILIGSCSSVVFYSLTHIFTYNLYLKGILMSTCLLHRCLTTVVPKGFVGLSFIPITRSYGDLLCVAQI